MPTHTWGTSHHHVKRPRYQPGFTCGLEQDGALIGYVLLRHVRWRFGAAILDVGMIEALYPDTTHHSQHLLETLLYELFRVCYDNAFALVGLRGVIVQCGVSSRMAAQPHHHYEVPFHSIGL
ncbi:MAG: hypothetical protein GFH25_541252n59 [Chloroflexi bacterium AL-N10]|nr:hypothetical protein [Chloroflexi bacterium AL-N10]